MCVIPLRQLARGPARGAGADRVPRRRRCVGQLRGGRADHAENCRREAQKTVMIQFEEIVAGREASRDRCRSR